MIHRIHSLLVTAYLLGGLTLMATTPWADLRGQLLNSGGSTIMELAHDPEQNVMHGAADNAAKQLMFGMLLFTLGGFIHAYERLRNERPVRITVKKKKPMLLYWLEMKL